MSDKAESQSNPLDTIKWLVVVALVGGLVYFNSAYGEISPLYRALAAVVVIAASLAVAATTTKGSAFFAFAKDARIEVRKVVWPERQEVVRLTLIILAATALVGVLLYFIDMLIVWAVGLITGIGA
ncbi:preprotein translocase subunit SecE [Agaribacter flavus]|uniref:Protein translocase subunit SecE n=1 Tax=Agaribacter flavus TaxID=1902781 RepID=A0ABV7FRE8_9ALTE